MESRAMAFFKTGAWILLLSGFAHAAIALPDVWRQGAFSPASDGAITVLKDTSLNIGVWLRGGNTAVFESAWGAYIGFAIAVGLLTGFLGLVLLLAANFKDVNDIRNRRLFNAALGASAVMTTVAALFYFWFPLTVLAASLVCFIIAWFSQRKGVTHAAR